MTLKIAVTPKGYDDIGAVLRKMDYKFTAINETQLHDLKQLSGYDVVFINCSGSCSRHAKQSAAALRKYVEKGGSLYCSDYAGDYVSAAFPGYINFRGNRGIMGSLTAQFRDEGLKAAIGEPLVLTFDMLFWRKIKSVREDVEVYLVAKNQPLLVTFEYGEGQVIYTCFHNKAQTSQQEQKLLKFLVLKPLLARAKSAISSFVASKAAGTVENVGTLSPGQTSPLYEYKSQAPTTLKFVLNWTGGPAKLVLSVLKPDGSLFRATEGISPPVQIAVPAAAPGSWKYQVRAIDVPTKHFPYVILAGPATQVAVQDPSFWPSRVSGPIVGTQVDAQILEQITIISSELPSADDISDLDIKILD